MAAINGPSSLAMSCARVRVIRDPHRGGELDATHSGLPSARDRYKMVAGSQKIESIRSPFREEAIISTICAAP